MTSFSTHFFAASGAFDVNRKSYASAVASRSAFLSAFLTILARVIFLGITLTSRSVVTGVSPFIYRVETLAGMRAAVRTTFLFKAYDKIVSFLAVTMMFTDTARVFFNRVVAAVNYFCKSALRTGVLFLRNGCSGFNRFSFLICC